MEGEALRFLRMLDDQPLGLVIKHFFAKHY